MTTSPRTPRPAAIAAPLLGTALVLALIAAIALRPTSPAAPEPAATITAPAPTLSPAAALAFERPIVLFSYPVDSCQQRYCLQPETVAHQLGAEFADAVSFVPIRTRASAAAGGYAVATSAPVLEGWDLYLLPPYDAWLSAAETAGGSAPSMVLIGRDRQVVERSTSSATIVAGLHTLLDSGAQR